MHRTGTQRCQRTIYVACGALAEDSVAAFARRLQLQTNKPVSRLSCQLLLKMVKGEMTAEMKLIENYLIHQVEARMFLVRCFQAVA